MIALCCIRLLEADGHTYHSHNQGVHLLFPCLRRRVCNCIPNVSYFVMPGFSLKSLKRWWYNLIISFQSKAVEVTPATKMDRPSKAYIWNSPVFLLACLGHFPPLAFRSTSIGSCFLAGKIFSWTFRGKKHPFLHFENKDSSQLSHIYKQQDLEEPCCYPFVKTSNKMRKAHPSV